MGRSPSSWSCSKHEEGLNRGGWTASEDKVLSEYIKTHGVDRWTTLPKKAGLKRNGKSCRLRWLNYLRPEIKRGNISPEEEELLIRLHRLLGNRWALIAGRLPGRTGNELKNYWNSQLSKRVPFKMGEFETKFQNSLKRKGVPSDSNYDEERIVGKVNYSHQTAVRYSGRADVDNLESYSYDGINKAADDDVVEIDTSKSWCQLLMENCMGDYQYDRLEAVNELQYKSIMSSSSGTDDLHQSTSSSISPSKTLQENHSSSSCNLFYQDFPDFDSSYFDSFLDPSMLSSSILP